MKPDTVFDAIRVRVMFLLGFVFLLLVAALIHRTINSGVTESERDLAATILLAVWPVFIIEMVWRIGQRDHTKPLRPQLRHAVLACLMPPWRMAFPDPQTGMIWIPRMGWHLPGKELTERLEHAFAGPMVLVALMIMPVLGLEYLRSDEVQNTPELSIALDVGIGVIWVAFALEFILKASAHPKPLLFTKLNWLDLAIVLLPMVEFILAKWHMAPLARLLRAGQALSPEQLARMERLYRLRGVATEGWHALLLLNFIARLVGHTPEKRLKRLGEKIAELEEELSELEKDANSLRERLAGSPRGEQNQNQPEETRSGGAMGELPNAGVTASKQPSEP